MKFMWAIVVSFLYLESCYVHADEHLLIQGGVNYYHEVSPKDRANMKKLYKLNLLTDKKRLLFESNKDLLENISVSPTKPLIAFIEINEGANFRTGIYEIPPQYSLTVIDTNGTVVFRINKTIRRYVWSPRGDKIAYLTFNLRDADYPFRFPTGVWILDLETGEDKKIANGAQEILWARFNSCIYFSDWRKVYKWDPKTDKIEVTDHKDIHFSPDGEYYLWLRHYEEIHPLRLYETKSNADISDILPKDIGTLSGWVFDKGHFLLFSKVAKSENFIFDVEKRKIVKKFEGKISKWKGDGSKIVVERNGKIFLEGIPEE